ncbi:MAG TPA: DUF1697 domain-containing protein [Verrucomicrobiae bacterium]|nr:DUF1697 domain-containing protein [Verrucomicrobiae bacterium]
MTVMISLLRGVNVGGHNKIKMDALRNLYEALGFRGAQTYVQSGNVIFRSKTSDIFKLAKRIEDAIEKSFGFRPPVVLRTSADMADVIARNPCAKRCGIDPKKLAVIFLKETPTAECLQNALKIKTAPEELWIDGREAYVYFPNGMARPKMSLPAIERALKTTGTGRNWNTVTMLLELAHALETKA